MHPSTTVKLHTLHLVITDYQVKWEWWASHHWFPSKMGVMSIASLICKFPMTHSILMAALVTEAYKTTFFLIMIYSDIIGRFSILMQSIPELEAWCCHPKLLRYPHKCALTCAHFSASFTWRGNMLYQTNMHYKIATYYLLDVHGNGKTHAGQNWGLFQRSVSPGGNFSIQPIDITQHHEGWGQDTMKKLCVVLCQEDCVGFIWDENMAETSWSDTPCLHFKTTN